MCSSIYFFHHIDITVSGQLPPQENYPPVRVRIWVRVRVRVRVGEQFSSRAVVLEPNITIKYTTRSTICVTDLCLYLCVLCAVWRDIAHHFFLSWSNRVKKELGWKSLKPLATEGSVQLS